MASAYQEKLQKLVYDATGETDVFNIPFEKVEDRDKIVFDKTYGNVLLANALLQTTKEANDYMNRVFKTELP